jgi:hypothetical protein
MMKTHPRRCTGRPIVSKKMLKAIARVSKQALKSGATKATLSPDGTVSLEFARTPAPDARSNGAGDGVLDLDRELQEFEERHGKA